MGFVWRADEVAAFVRVNFVSPADLGHYETILAAALIKTAQRPERSLQKKRKSSARVNKQTFNGIYIFVNV